MPEDGITPTVRTYFSRFTVGDIIDRIRIVKEDAVFRWLDEYGVRPEQVLIIGSYLTGAGLANRLVHASSVTVMDIHVHLRRFLDPRVEFIESVHTLRNRHFDCIIDTSGLGGIKPADLQSLDPPHVFLAEDPGSDGSDDALLQINQASLLLETIPAPVRGLLYTDGLRTKTSGTMTLTVEILRRSMEDALKEEGVLYSTASLEFYERILFRERDVDAFLERLKRPALIVSSLREIDCDAILQGNLLPLQSRVIPWFGKGV